MRPPDRVATAVQCTTHTSVSTLAPAWDDLADRTAAPPWSRPGWMQAWWHAFGRGRLEILAVHRDGELAGVLPLAKRMRWRTSLANSHSPAFAPVALDLDANRALAEALFGKRSAYGVSLYPLPTGEAGVEALEGVARASGHRILSHVRMRSPYVALEGTYEEFLSGPRPAHRVLKDIERCRRGLERQGTLSFSVEDGSTGLDARLDEGLQVEARGWQGSKGTAMASRPNIRHFYTDVAKWAAGRGWLRLLFLRVDDRAVAFEYCMEMNGALYVLKIGYDSEYRKWGPGKILIHEAIAWCYARGLQTFELLGTDEPYKLQWTDRVRERCVLRAFATTPAGTAAWAAWAFGRPAAKRAVARARALSP